MSDVAELVAQCREDLTMSKFLRKEHLLARANEDRVNAANALEAMAAELSVCRAEVGHYQAERDAAEFRLAAMAPVVEAARAWAAARNGSGPYHLDCDRLEKALAKLEAANV